MEVTVRHLGNVQFESSARGHRVICDQPADNGGENAGMTPPELLLASLGACSAHYAVQYLKAWNLSAAGLEIRVHGDKVKPPARVGQILIEVFLPGLDASHEAGMQRAVDACLIHNTLMHLPAIETVVRTAVEASAR
jgi:putative redox protein